MAEFIRSSPTPVGKREIARAFDIRGDRRVALKGLIKDLERDGLVERKPGRSRKVTPPEGLPEVTVVQVAEIDEDGETIATPTSWRGEGPPPRIFMQPEKRGHPALDVGDRALVRLRRLDQETYEGRTIRRLDQRPAERVVGVISLTASGGLVSPADKRRSDDLFVRAEDLGGAESGELVVVDLPPGAGRQGRRPATVIDRLGDPEHPRSISLIAIHAQGIPTEFPKAAVEEAEAATLPSLSGREDLRHLPLVTIDGADAKDFDDAVFAEPDPEREGGWHIVVAIADVAHYVPSGSALDREALKRGNSCYFPDRVVPMLPEALSNGLCSLRPEEDRGCLAAHMWIGPDGTLHRKRFVRGLMRSDARLTYEQVQSARNGALDEATAPLVDTVIEPLYGAFAALAEARRERGTLELDLPERRIELDEAGRVRAIGERARLDSHRLIEEFMILANVAAAQTLEERRLPCLFRVHDSPDDAKVEALREFLEPLGYRLARTGLALPRNFSHLVASAHGRPEAQLVAEMVLRAQAQAIYSPDNIGHFGLALPRYAHFTSPIRRYADLTVHRGLVRGLGLGEDGSPDEELARLEEIGEHVSTTERRASAAERDASDRYLASFLAARIGEAAAGRISGVTRFGLFVKLDETGADGLVPISSLPDDFYVHDEHAHALVGRRWGLIYRLGARVTIRIVEADAVTGSTVFALTGAALEEGAELAFDGPGAPP
ncbi:MAG: ribonuclease R, partial [Azospirillaceae bacterium]